MANTSEAPAHLALRKFLKLFRYLRQYARQIDEHGIKPWQLSVLLFLKEAGPATVGQVQEYLYQSPSTASNVVAQLEKAGYVTRTRSEADNRVVIVELTPAGREQAERTPLGGIPLLRRRLNALSEERLERINDALADIMELMEVADEE